MFSPNPQIIGLDRSSFTGILAIDEVHRQIILLYSKMDLKLSFFCFYIMGIPPHVFLQMNILSI